MPSDNPPSTIAAVPAPSGITPSTSRLGRLLVVLTSPWALAGYYVWIGEIWISVNIASFLVGGPGSLVNLFTADGTFALALAAALTIRSEKRARHEDLTERAENRRRSLELHEKEIEPHLTIDEGHRTVELPLTAGGAPGGTHEDTYMVLRNVGPGIATDLRVEFLATLRPIRTLLPPGLEDEDLPPREDPGRLSPRHRAYLRSEGEEWIVFDPDEWERGLRVWETYFDVEDEELIQVRVRVFCSNLEDTPCGGVEATFTREDPPDGTGDPREADYWLATKDGKSAWGLSGGPTRILPGANGVAATEH